MTRIRQLADKLQRITADYESRLKDAQARYRGDQQGLTERTFAGTVSFKLIYLCKKRKHMYTIRLRVNEKVYKNLMWFLQRFSKEEIQVIRENNEFLSVQQYLKEELASVEEGTAEYISLEELNQELEFAIRKHED